MLRVRTTPDAMKAFEAKAKASKQNLSDWIRETLNAAS
jgi:predicted HicB family RNase H-like nuclease